MVFETMKSLYSVTAFLYIMPSFFVTFGKKAKPSEIGNKAYVLFLLKKMNFNVPEGFVINKKLFERIVSEQGIKSEILRLASSGSNAKLVKQILSKIRNKILSYSFDEDLKKQILCRLKNMKQKRTGFAVRSSSIQEDKYKTSFAGIYSSFLNVSENNVIEKIKLVYASVFSERAFEYYKKNKTNILRAKMAVIIQNTLKSEKAGVIFTKNPIDNKKEFLIEATGGLGDRLIAGALKPNTYLVRKKQVVKFPLEKEVLTKKEVFCLVKLSKKIEKIFGAPQDIEWALSKKRFYVLQARPITTNIKKERKTKAFFGNMFTGLGASPGIVQGKARNIKNIKNLKKIKKGEIIVSSIIAMTFVKVFNKIKAMVAEQGGILSHPAIVARELKIPMVVDLKNATKIIRTGDKVLVDGCAGSVYVKRKKDAKKTKIFSYAPDDINSISMAGKLKSLEFKTKEGLTVPILYRKKGKKVLVYLFHFYGGFLSNFDKIIRFIRKNFPNKEIIWVDGEKAHSFYFAYGLSKRREFKSIIPRMIKAGKKFDLKELRLLFSLILKKSKKKRFESKKIRIKRKEKKKIISKLRLLSTISNYSVLIDIFFCTNYGKMLLERKLRKMLKKYNFSLGELLAYPKSQNCKFFTKKERKTLSEAFKFYSFISWWKNNYRKEFEKIGCKMEWLNKQITPLARELSKTEGQTKALNKS